MALLYVYCSSICKQIASTSSFGACALWLKSHSDQGFPVVSSLLCFVLRVESLSLKSLHFDDDPFWMLTTSKRRSARIYNISIYRHPLVASTNMEVQWSFLLHRGITLLFSIALYQPIPVLISLHPSAFSWASIYARFEIKNSPLMCCCTAFLA